MLTPQFIYIDDEPVNRSNYLQSVYRKLDRLMEKNQDNEKPRALKAILLESAKHDLWEVCYYIIHHTNFCIFKAWFDEAEKKAWDRVPPSLSYKPDQKNRSKFYFSLLKVADSSKIDISDHLKREGKGKPSDFMKTYEKDVLGFVMKIPDEM